MDKSVIPVRLLLVSASRDENGLEDEPIRIMTTGKLKPISSGFLLRYEENFPDEVTGQNQISQVTLSLQPERVVMSRSGEIAATMVFVKDTRFEGIYRTPYGDMNLALYTTHVSCRATPEKGSVRLEYQIDMHGRYAATQIISMDYEAESC